MAAHRASHDVNRVKEDAVAIRQEIVRLGLNMAKSKSNQGQLLADASSKAVEDGKLAKAADQLDKKVDKEIEKNEEMVSTVNDAAAAADADQTHVINSDLMNMYVQDENDRSKE